MWARARAPVVGQLKCRERHSKPRRAPEPEPHKFCHRQTHPQLQGSNNTASHRPSPLLVLLVLPRPPPLGVPLRLARQRTAQCACFSILPLSRPATEAAGESRASWVLRGVGPTTGSQQSPAAAAAEEEEEEEEAAAAATATATAAQSNSSDSSRIATRFCTWTASRPRPAVTSATASSRAVAVAAFLFFFFFLGPKANRAGGYIARLDHLLWSPSSSLFPYPPCRYRPGLFSASKNRTHRQHLRSRFPSPTPPNSRFFFFFCFFVCIVPPSSLHLLPAEPSLPAVALTSSEQLPRHHPHPRPA